MAIKEGLINSTWLLQSLRLLGSENFFQYHSDHICNQAAKIYYAYFQVINKGIGLFGMYSFCFLKLPETFSSLNTFF